jgi:hypothetical protein
MFGDNNNDDSDDDDDDDDDEEEEEEGTIMSSGTFCNIDVIRRESSSLVVSLMTLIGKDVSRGKRAL